MSEFVNTIDTLGDDVVLDSLIDRTITEFKDDSLTEVGGRAFFGCESLVIVVLPKVNTVGTEAFQFCTSLKIVDFSSTVTFTGYDAFRYTNGSNLIAVLFRDENGVSSFSGAFKNCDAITVNKTGYIYVPKALVDAYKTNTDTSAYAEQIRALEDYTVDGTITGKLDETKI